MSAWGVLQKRSFLGVGTFCRTKLLGSVTKNRSFQNVPMFTFKHTYLFVNVGMFETTYIL